jgi:hypothetical protein
MLSIMIGTVWPYHSLDVVDRGQIRGAAGISPTFIASDRLPFHCVDRHYPPPPVQLVPSLNTAPLSNPTHSDPSVAHPVPNHRSLNSSSTHLSLNTNYRSTIHNHPSLKKFLTTHHAPPKRTQPAHHSPFPSPRQSLPTAPRSTSKPTRQRHRSRAPPHPRTLPCPRPRPLSKRLVHHAIHLYQPPGHTTHGRAVQGLRTNDEAPRDVHCRPEFIDRG